ncbi:hypothetical protein [Streptomyces sp. Rer75]|uniref:hypothetical protein n=1 Tax=unclassified Streptomyces TaxID=2593676 RepID=UPI0015D0A34A|nr:hypothetical protein [Streptomyces sp. Rer75]QLH22627.1 hypothetical protein HYQ63_20085 [Streptomyces sp. Rer75]
MPRGRHRQSPPLHRLLPPLSVAAASITCAAGAWLVGDTVVIRGLAATAATAAVVGSVLTRRWDRAAGRRVAEAASETARQEMKYEERIAELEADAEKAAELRTALNTRLRAKRAELARLRNEHAELLRRYATAETERASALEGRRRLALEAAVPSKELTAGEPSGETVADAESAESAESVGDGLDLSAYARADEALSRLVASARQQRERAEAESRALAAEQEKAEAEAREQEKAEATDSKAGRTAADPDEDGAAVPGKRPAADERDGPDSSPVPPPHARTAASAVVPYAAARRAASRSESGFDYFGTQKNPPKQQEPEPEAEEDLADVIGAETLAETRKGAVGEVIDLTAHEENEPIGIEELRSAIS